jgi:molecular chaperone Hsp33
MGASVQSSSLRPQSHWVKCISTNGNLRGVGIEATSALRELAQRHQLTPEGVRFLAEAAIGAFMLGSYCKAGERVNLNIQGSGHCSQVLVEALPTGHFRGYAVERTGQVVTFDIQGPWGTGMLSVLRSKVEPGAQPWIGTVPLVTGHLAKDLTYYWAQSEQVPTAIGIHVRLDDTGKIALAAGFLVQAMPGATVDEISKIEEHLRDLHQAEDHFQKIFEEDAAQPMRLLSRVFQSSPFVKLEETPIVFKCSCSRERVENAMILVGTQELRSMLNEDHGASVRCDFCATDYIVDSKRLEELIEESDRRSGKPTGSS